MKKFQPGAIIPLSSYYKDRNKLHQNNKQPLSDQKHQEQQPHSNTHKEEFDNQQQDHVQHQRQVDI